MPSMSSTVTFKWVATTLITILIAFLGGIGGYVLNGQDARIDTNSTEISQNQKDLAKIVETLGIVVEHNEGHEKLADERYLNIQQDLRDIQAKLQ